MLLERFLLELLFFEEPLLRIEEVPPELALAVCAELALVVVELVSVLVAQDEKRAAVARQRMEVRMDLFMVVRLKARDNSAHAETASLYFTIAGEPLTGSFYSARSRAMSGLTRVARRARTKIESAATALSSPTTAE